MAKGKDFLKSTEPEWLMLSLTVLLLLVMAFFSLRSYSSRYQATKATAQSLKTLIQVESLLSHLKDAESGQRGFLLTGKASYLSPYLTARAAVTKDLETLSKITSTDAIDQNQLVLLTPLVLSKLEELQKTTELQSQKDKEAAMRIVNSDSGQKTMEQIRAILLDIKNRETIDLQARTQAAEDATQTATWWTSWLEISIAILVFTTMIILIQQSKKRDKSQEAIRKSEENFRILISNILDYAIFMLDPKGNVVIWNEGAQRLKGYSAEEICGKHFSILYPQEDIDAGKPEHGLQEALKNSRFEDTGWRVRKDGSRFFANVVITTSKDQNGILRGFSKVTRDITESKIAEDKLIQSAEEMRILNAELEQARDQAQIASKFKSEFVANMSHEIRTPMNGIIGMCSILLKTKLDESQHQYAEAIRSAATALLTVINDILDFSKIEAGRIELEQSDFDPVRAVESACEIVAAQARTKELSLLSFIDPKMPKTLHGDSERLRQVIINLASNAVKFADSGEIVIKALVDSVHGNEINVRFLVIDNGIGMSEDEQNRLFQPFVQADGSISRKFGGTGLGLSISKSLVDLMNGVIGVESKKGEGSTFWFNIPFQFSSEDLAINTHDELKGVRVLIIDDEPNSREILHSYVISWGMRNGSASNAEEALQLLRKAQEDNDPYSVAIVDLVMAGKNGIATAKEIFSDPLLSSTKLILLTAFDTPGLGAQAIDLGFKAYITKPVRQSLMLDCLTTVVCGGRSIIARTSVERQTTSLPVQVSPSRTELVLVAEDHPINQAVAKLYLEELGFACHVVNDGKEVISALANNYYALILMDCQMPEMDGLMATSLIRKREASTGLHIPIVAMTAHALKEDRLKCLAAGMDDYISKPVDLELLRSILDKWLPLDSSAGRNEISYQLVMNAERDSTIPINIENLQTKFGDFASEMTDMFVQETPNQLSALQMSLATNDLSAVLKKAHQLKGVCAAIGAYPMYNSCIAIENSAHEKDLHALNLQIGQLHVQFSDVRKELQL